MAKAKQPAHVTRALNDTLAFTEWCIEHRPEVVEDFSVFADKSARLAELEATIRQAVEAANALREELGQHVGPAEVIPTANPKRTRRARPEPEPEPAAEPEAAREPDTSTVSTEPDTEPEMPPSDFDESDFGDFEIPPDDANDEF